jgi:hypothetical protein
MRQELKIFPSPVLFWAKSSREAKFQFVLLQTIFSRERNPAEINDPTPPLHSIAEGGG